MLLLAMDCEEDTHVCVFDDACAEEEESASDEMGRQHSKETMPSPQTKKTTAHLRHTHL